MAQAGPEGQGAEDQQERRCEDRQQANHAAEPAVRGLVHRGAEEGGEGEQRAGDGLGGAVAGEEHVVAHPLWRHHLGLQQWQHHVAAAEHEGAGAVERVHQGQGRAGPPVGQDRQAHQQQQEQPQPQRAGAAADGDGQRVGFGIRRRFEQQQAPHASGGDHPHLGPGGRFQQHHARGDQHQRDPRHAPAQVARHAPHGLGHHGHGDDFKPMQRAGRHRGAIVGEAQGEQDQGDGRRQRKPDPGGDRPAITCAGQAQGNADLTAGRAGKELAQGDQFGVTALAQPTPPGDELVAKIPKVRNRAAEGSKPQAQENQEHRPGTSGGVGQEGELGLRCGAP